MLFHVRVSSDKIRTLGAGEVPHGLLFLEIDVSFIADHSFSLVEGLSESTSFGEWIWTSSSTHVSILSFKSFSVDGYRPSLLVVALRYSQSELFVGCKLLPAVHACFNNESLTTSTHLHKFTVLRLHDFPSDDVCGQILLREGLSVCSVEVSLSISSRFLVSPLLHLFCHLHFNGFLLHLGFAADLSNAVCLVLGISVFSVVRGHDLRFCFSVDPD